MSSLILHVLLLSAMDPLSLSPRQAPHTYSKHSSEPRLCTLLFYMVASFDVQSTPPRKQNIVQ